MKLRPGQEKSEHTLSRTHALKITELKKSDGYIELIASGLDSNYRSTISKLHNVLVIPKTAHQLATLLSATFNMTTIRMAVRWFVMMFALFLPCQISCIEKNNLNDLILTELKLLRNEVATLKQNNKNNEERILRLEKENSNLQNENSNLKKEVSEINKRLDTMNTIRDEIEVPEPQHVDKDMGLESNVNTTVTYQPSKVFYRNRNLQPNIFYLLSWRAC